MDFKQNNTISVLTNYIIPIGRIDLLYFSYFFVLCALDLVVRYLFFVSHSDRLFCVVFIFVRF